MSRLRPNLHLHLHLHLQPPTSNPHLLSWASRTLDAAVALLAGWAIICWLAVGLGWPFVVLRQLWPLAVGAMLAVLLWPERAQEVEPEATQQTANADGPARPLWLALVIAAAAGALFSLKRPGLGWVAAMAALAIWLWGRRGKSITEPAVLETPSPGSRLAPWLVGVSCLAAVLTVLLVNRPNVDDSFYINAIQAPLEHPELPVLTFDDMHGERGWALLNPLDKVMAYLPAVSVLAKLSGVAVVPLYHLVLPSILACLVVLVHALLLERTVGRGWWWALLAVVLIFLAWGDQPRNLGCFAFVRLFQGKAVFASLLAPAIVWYAWEFARRPSARGAVMLSACQLAAAACTSSALLLGPMACALATAATWRWSWTWRWRWRWSDVGRCLVAALTCAPCLAALLWLWLRYPAIDASIEHSTSGGLDLSLGSGFRGAMAFAAPLLIVLAAGAGQRTKYLRAYAILVSVALLCPLSSWAMDKVAHNMAWRMAWVTPFPLLIATAVAAVARLEPFATGAAWKARQTLLARVVACGLLGLFAVAGSWSVASGWSALGWHRAKFRQPARDVAEAVTRRHGPEKLVLAPTPVATVIAALPDAPRLVAVTDRYLTLMSGSMGAQRAQQRLALLRLVDDGGAEAIAAARPLLPACGADVIVVPPQRGQAAQVRTALAEAGYACEDTTQGYECWIRQRGDQETGGPPPSTAATAVRSVRE